MKNKKKVLLWTLLAGTAGAAFTALFSILDGGQAALQLAIFGFFAGGLGGFLAAYFEDLPANKRKAGERGRGLDSIFGNYPGNDDIPSSDSRKTRKRKGKL